MDSASATIIAGAAGLLGSIIGGIVAFWGSKRAAMESIKAQQNFFEQQVRHEEEKQLLFVKTCARTVFADMFSVINEIIRIRRPASLPYVGIGRPQVLTYDSNYTEKVASLSEHLEFSEILTIYEIYGYMSKYNNFAIADSKNVNGSEDAQLIAKTLGVRIFGAFFDDVVSNTTSSRNLDIDKLIDEMKMKGNKELFHKLKKLI
jgi:hypothetical protein